MAELIDTNVFIDYLRKELKARNYLESKTSPCLSVISYVELVRGAKDKKEQRIIVKLLSKATVIPITPSVGDTMLSLIKSYALSHGLTIPDALIAATALEENLILVTSNIRHFNFIKSLKVVDWKEITI